MNNQTKIAILGGSVKSAVGRAHIAALRLTGRYEIVAGFMSRDHRLNVESGVEYGIPLNQIFDSFDKLLSFASENRVTILICTPTDQHAGQVKMCLQLGIDVICEKALSDSVSSLREIYSASLESKSNLSVIYNYTSFPAVRVLRNLVSDGRIGEILKINAHMPQEGFIKKDSNGNPMTPQAWRLKDGDIPTISLDLGVHLHSLVKFITGMSAIELVAKESSNGNFDGIIDDVRCLAIYEQNLEVNYWYSKIALGNRNGLRIEIYGTAGSAIWEQMNPESVTFTDSTGEKTQIDRGSPSNIIGNEDKYNYFKPGHPTGFIEALSNYYLDIYEVSENKISGDSPKNVFGVTEALEGMIFLEGIHKSSRTKSWVNLLQ